MIVLARADGPPRHAIHHVGIVPHRVAGNLASRGEKARFSHGRNLPCALRSRGLYVVRRDLAGDQEPQQDRDAFRNVALAQRPAAPRARIGADQRGRPGLRETEAGEGGAELVLS